MNLVKAHNLVYQYHFSVKGWFSNIISNRWKNRPEPLLAIQIKTSVVFKQLASYIFAF